MSNLAWEPHSRISGLVVIEVEAWAAFLGPTVWGCPPTSWGQEASQLPARSEAFPASGGLGHPDAFPSFLGVVSPSPQSDPQKLCGPCQG